MLLELIEPLKKDSIWPALIIIGEAYLCVLFIIASELKNKVEMIIHAPTTKATRRGSMGTLGMHVGKIAIVVPNAQLVFKY